MNKSGKIWVWLLILAVVALSITAISMKNSADGSIKAATEEADKAKAEIAAVQAELAGVQEELAGVQGELDGAKTELEAAVATAAEVQKELDNSPTVQEIQDLTSENTALQVQIKDKDEALADIEAELAELKTTAAEIPGLMDALAGATNALADTKTELVNTKGLFNMAEAGVKTQLEKITALNADIAKLNKEIEDLKAQIGEGVEIVVADIDDADALKELETKYGKLLDEITERIKELTADAAA